MRCLLCLIYLCALVGCGMPSSQFSGIPATRVTVGKSTFDVRVRGYLFEAIRMTPEHRARMGPVSDHARAAVQQVTGCAVGSIDGDPAVLQGYLTCPGAARPNIIIVAPQAYDCMEMPSSIPARNGWKYVDYDCTAY